MPTTCHLNASHLTTWPWVNIIKVSYGAYDLTELNIILNIIQAFSQIKIALILFFLLLNFLSARTQIDVWSIRGNYDLGFNVFMIDEYSLIFKIIYENCTTIFEDSHGCWKNAKCRTEWAELKTLTCKLSNTNLPTDTDQEVRTGCLLFRSNHEASFCYRKCELY